MRRRSIYRRCAILLLMANGLALLFANDGPIDMGGGDTLHPVSTSKISINDEKLLISYDAPNDQWKVTVDFIFLNPTDQTVSLDVAFVSHSQPRNGTTALAGIRNFQTLVEGTPVEYRHYWEPEKILLDLYELGAFMQEYFVFSVEFHPGQTRIRHSYSYHGLIGYFKEHGFSYVLMTAKLWNGPIGTFFVQIDLPKGSFLETDQLGDLKPFGKYRFFSKRIISWIHGETLYIQDGGLSLAAANYVPQHDLYLQFALFSEYLAGEVIYGSYGGISLDRLTTERLERADLSGASTPELRILRNTIFALAGYSFRDKELDEYFSHYFWYESDSPGMRELTDIEIHNIRLIQLLESATVCAITNR